MIAIQVYPSKRKKERKQYQTSLYHNCLMILYHSNYYIFKKTQDRTYINHNQLDTLLQPRIIDTNIVVL